MEYIYISSAIVVCSPCCGWLFVTPWTAAREASLSFTISWSLLKLMSIESVMPSSHLILCLPLPLPSVFSRIRVFSSKAALRTRWPEYWSFSIRPSMNTQGWLPLGWTGWISLLSKGLTRVFSNTAVQILWHSAFFIVPLSQLYMTNGKTIALTIQTFVAKVTSLLFNTLSRFVIAFLPSSKCLLISWRQSAIVGTAKHFFHTRGTSFTLPTMWKNVVAPHLHQHSSVSLLLCWQISSGISLWS